MISNDINEVLTVKSMRIPKLVPTANNVLYGHFGHNEVLVRNNVIKKEYSFYNYLCISVFISFTFGLLLGIVLMSTTQKYSTSSRKYDPTNVNLSRTLNSFKNEANFKKTDKKLDEKTYNKYSKVSFTGADGHKFKKDVYPKGLTEDMMDILKDNKITQRKHNIVQVNNNKTNLVLSKTTVLYDNVYWGPEIEDSMPQGYGENTADIWERYVGQSEIIKMEEGCGRMQNRLVTFSDGTQACVRYRQNTDQIQGEIFSFYFGRLLNLTNLAPSVVKAVDLKDKLWKNIGSDIVKANWDTNRPVVITQYIPSLEPANFPEIFKPSNRHLNKFDVLNMVSKENETSEANKELLINRLKNKHKKKDSKDESQKFSIIDMKLTKKTISSFVELAQWSDLIIFDYITANLDRIVNNLFNFQWNENIMDGPAHNLARKMDSGLLLFLDNESALWHGYRLLKKYNTYHSMMLDNLCVFRKTTVDALRHLQGSKSVGALLTGIFHKKNNAVIKDILPPIPEKNSKILTERINEVIKQIEKCEQNYR